MQAYLEALRAALASLSAHRMRSSLTTLGILIGTGSVIAVVPLVQGFSASISDQFAAIGGSTLTLHAVDTNENCRTGKLTYITCADGDVPRYRGPGAPHARP